MAVGAYDEERGKGAAYIFTRTGAKWAQQIRLMASNAEDGDSLGCSIAISDDGNTMVAGAFDEDSLLRGIQPPTEGSNDAASDVSTGAAYVFVRTGSAWTQQAFIKATNTRLNDQFAWALSLSRDGNTLAVGSHLEDSGAKGLNGDQEDATAEDSGAVYIYARTGTTWAPASYVKASVPHANAEFGIRSHSEATEKSWLSAPSKTAEVAPASIRPQPPSHQRNPARHFCLLLSLNHRLRFPRQRREGRSSRGNALGGMPIISFRPEGAGRSCALEAQQTDGSQHPWRCPRLASNGAFSARRCGFF